MVRKNGSNCLHRATVTFEYYLTRALEEAYKVGQKPIGADMIENVLAKHPVIRIVLFISFVLVSSVGTAPGQQASASLAKANAAPTPIPLAKVALKAQSALASLQEIDASVCVEITETEKWVTD